MFTGIIECLGTILAIKRFSQQLILRIAACALKAIKLGESIAVNGICLTVTNCDQNWFEVYVSITTAKATNLAKLRISQNVNLERALLVGDRIGGHFLSGHIDTTGVVKKVLLRGSSKLLQINFAKQYTSYLALKGSIALDGISLTIEQFGNGFLQVNIIPTTLKTTTILTWRVGCHVNLEFDMMNKYFYQQRFQKPYE